MTNAVMEHLTKKNKILLDKISEVKSKIYIFDIPHIEYTTDEEIDAFIPLYELNFKKASELRFAHEFVRSYISNKKYYLTIICLLDRQARDIEELYLSYEQDPYLV